MQRERRSVFQVCTASSAALIATSYMPNIPNINISKMEKGGDKTKSNSTPKKNTELRQEYNDDEEDDVFEF